METLISFQHEVSRAISWAILHSFWQGAIILFLYHASIYFKKSSAAWRFNLAIGAIALLAVSFLNTIIFYLKQTELDPSQSLVIFSVQTSIEQSSWVNWIEHHAYIIQLCWSIGLIIFVFRMIVGISFLQYLKIDRKPILNQPLNDYIKKAMFQLGISKNVKFFEHPLVKSPFTEGFLRPVIYVPIGFINRMSCQEVEAILAHELAHIRRHDFILNIFVSIAELLLYYHPVMWWFSSIIRAEREEASDDLAVSITGDRLAYAKALLNIKELDSYGTPSLALGFSHSNDKYLLNRIKHILNMPYTKSNFKEKLITLSLLFAFAFIFAKSDMTSKDITFNERLAEITILPDASIKLDTLPKLKRNDSFSIIRSNGKEDVELNMENGEITKLKINGELISPSDYEKHQKTIDEIKPNRKNRGFYFGSDGVKELEPFEFNFQGFDGDLLNGFAFEMPKAQSYRFRFDSLKNLIKQWSNNDSIFTSKIDSLKKAQSLLLKNEDLFSDRGIKRLLDLDDLQNLTEMERILPDNFKGFEFQIPNEFDADNIKQRYLNHDENNLEDLIGKQLNKDGFLVPGKENKVELTGKHLKINGEKQPSNIHNKYLRLFEQETGISMSKNSKLEFNIEGKEAKRKFKAF